MTEGPRNSLHDHQPAAQSQIKQNISGQISPPTRPCRENLTSKIERALIQNLHPGEELIPGTLPSTLPVLCGELKTTWRAKVEKKNPNWKNGDYHLLPHLSECVSV